MSKALTLGLIGALALSGCANMSERERGTAQGAAIGAVAGAIIGSATGGKPGQSAAIGAADVVLTTGLEYVLGVKD